MQQGSVGFVRLDQPLTGRWPFSDFPERVQLLGRSFSRSNTWNFPYSGVSAQYREDRDHDSMHVFVHDDGTWSIDHIDAANPERGHVIEHAFRDVSQTPAGAVAVTLLVVAGSAGLSTLLFRR